MKDLNLVFKYLDFMLEIKFLEQKDLREIENNLWGILGSPPRLDRGFIAFGDRYKEPYCEFIIYKLNIVRGYRKYKIIAETGEFENEEGKELLPVKILEPCIYRPALSGRKEWEVFTMLKDVYRKRKIDAHAYLMYVKIASMSKDDLISNIKSAKKFDQYHKWEFGFYGGATGFLIGVIIYVISEHTSVPITKLLDGPKILGLTTFLGGTVGSSIPEFNVWKETNKWRDETYEKIRLIAEGLEAKLY